MPPAEPAPPEKFPCKNCGTPITGYPCPVCGWSPKPTKLQKIAGFAPPLSGIVFWIILIVYLWWVFFDWIGVGLKFLFGLARVPYADILIVPLQWVAIILIAYLLADGIGKFGFIGGTALLILVMVIPLMVKGAIEPWFAKGGPFYEQAAFLQCLAEGGSFVECGMVTRPAKPPEPEKVGVKRILTMEFGSEDIPLPPVIYGEIYEFPVTFTVHPDFELSVKIKEGELSNETHGVADTGIFLKPDIDEWTFPKNSLPLVVVYNTSDKIQTKERKYVFFKIEAEYDLHTSGTNDFVIAGDERAIPRLVEGCVEPELKRVLGKPCSGAGPVDVILYFTPPYYTLDKPREELKLRVDIINRERGEAILRDIKIERLTEAPEIEPAKPDNCYAPRGVRNFPENVMKELKNHKVIRIGKDEVYSIVCEYNIKKDKVEETLIGPSKTIKFQVVLHYTFRKTAEMSKMVMPAPKE